MYLTKTLKYESKAHTQCFAMANLCSVKLLVSIPLHFLEKKNETIFVNSIENLKIVT